MSQGRTKRSEKGLLTPDNCAVTFIDLQPQMLFGVANFDRQSIINNNVALAKAARVFQAGAKPVTALSVMLEWQRDWAEKDTYDAVMDIVKTHFGAYGVGVEYAYTMVHGAAATKLPEYVVPSAAPHK